MRLGFVSDLHGNLPALEAALADLERIGVDEVICLGDVVDLGPEPGAVVDLLRARGIATVQGNHDHLTEHPIAPFLADIERWTATVLGPEQRAWLDALPRALTRDADQAQLLAVHGSPRAATEGVLADTPLATLRAWAAGEDFDVLVCGHTHVQTLRRDEARSWVNVGSVGMPFAAPVRKDPPIGLPWAEFALVTLGRHTCVEFRRVSYDLSRLFDAVRRTGMPHGEAFIAQWRR